MVVYSLSASTASRTTHRKSNKNGGLSDGVKTMMAQIKAIAPQLGDETLAELNMFSNLMVVYSLSASTASRTTTSKMFWRRPRHVPNVVSF